MGSLQRRIAAIRLIINGDKPNLPNIALETNAFLVPFLPITKKNLSSVLRLALSALLSHLLVPSIKHCRP